jgi:hypothetical protein
MTILLDAKESGKRMKKKGKGNDVQKSPFATFHPTAQEREFLKEDAPSLSDALSTISEFCKDNIQFSLGYKAENSGYFAMVRDKVGDWTEQACLSYWNSDPEKAVIGLAFALQGRYSNFPNLQIGLPGFTDEW